MSKVLKNYDFILSFFCPSKDFSRWLWLFTCQPMRTQAGRTTLSLQQSRWFLLLAEKTQERTLLGNSQRFQIHMLIVSVKYLSITLILIISSKYPHNIKSHSNLFRQLHFRSPPWNIRRSLFAVRGWPQIHLIGEYLLLEPIICRTNAGCLNSSLTRMCGKVELTPKVTFGCLGGILCKKSQKQFEIWRRKNPQVPNEEIKNMFSGLSSAQLSAIKKEYQASSFPGLDIPMNQVITMISIVMIIMIMTVKIVMMEMMISGDSNNDNINIRW